MRSTRLLLSLVLSLLAALAMPVAGIAATTLGETAPPGALLAACDDNTSIVQVSSSDGISYVVPAGGGVITQWSTRAGPSGGSLALQTLSQQSPSQFSALAESAVESPPLLVLSSYPTRIPVGGGARIGLRAVDGDPGCYSDAGVGDQARATLGAAPIPGGGPANFNSGLSGYRVNVAATLESDADGDGFGDETQDGCVGNGQRADDCVDPSVSIGKAPKKKTSKRKAEFAFSSDDPLAAFECRIDLSSFEPCTSPLKSKRLKRGKHIFEVRALDPNQNVSPTATIRWRIKKEKHRR